MARVFQNNRDGRTGRAGHAGQAGSMIGLFLLKIGGPGSGPGAAPVLARIEGQLYALAFSTARRLAFARESLGLDEAQPFYVCEANRKAVEHDLVAAGARGYIVDYDSASETFTSAGALPTMTLTI